MNRKEYNQCVDRFSDFVFRFIYRSMKDKDKANDIVQESFLKLWEKRADIDVNKAKSYLFKTAYHAMIDLIRKDKRLVSQDNFKPSSFAHRDEYSDLQEVLHHAVGKLPDIQRSVVLLRDYEGYSYKEIEGITGLNESQVKVYIYRARIFLKDYLKSIHYII